MPGANLLNRLERRIITTITFEALVSGLAAATPTLWTTTGRVLIRSLSAFCTTSLTESAGTTIELGTVNNSAGLIGQTNVTDIDVGEFWRDATPEFHVSPAVVNMNVGKSSGAAGDVRYVVGGGGNITAGVIEFVALWVPLSSDGLLA